jgi:heavy metal translocating P-type ATPase
MQRFGEADRRFCCVGCMNVYSILAESGVLASGQDLRETELFKRSLELGLIAQSPADSPEKNSPAAPHDSPTEEVLLQVSGMWCSSCAWLIEHSLASLPGLVSAEAFFSSDTVKVKYCPQYLPPNRIVERIARLGYKAQEYTGESEAKEAERRDLLVRFGVAAFFWANIMAFSLVIYASYFEQISSSVRRNMPFLLMALATPVVFYCGQPILKLAWHGLLNRTIRMESLLSMGILAAYSLSVVQSFRGQTHVYFDTASAIVTLVLAGKLIERNAKDRTSRWYTMLHRMMPNKARLLVDGRERFVSVDAIEPGTIFVVKAGERIPADGVIADGQSHADESLLTGESAPVAKNAGDFAVAGSINVGGVLQICATRTAADSTLARIVSLVEKALSSRSSIERTVDHVSRIFVPCIVLVAVTVFLACWLSGTLAFTAALMRAITVLIISCPCALGVATPLAVTAAMGYASRRGILVGDSRVLETARNVSDVILDKTGTITEGCFSLLEFELCPASRSKASEALSLLASLEQYSEHPLGKAVVDHARNHALTFHDAKPVEIVEGQGIVGRVCERLVFAGNRALAEKLTGTFDPAIQARALQWEQEGKTVVFAGWDNQLRGILAFGDRIRDAAAELVAELKQHGVKVHVVSGDSTATTRWVASCVGADQYHAEILPEDKAVIVRELQNKGSVVAMIGDGVNDSPALAQANLGIAMGSGADIAMKAAAVVLVRGSLRKVTGIFNLAQKTMRVVRQNLFWAFFYNTLAIILAVAGVLNPIMAAGAMLISSLSVIANSMRLQRDDSGQ